jgi:putative endonuclease
MTKGHTNRTEKRRIGDLGESIACDFLTKRGFTVVDKNYLRKWGEIDIVAKKGDIYHFVEVKSVSCVTLPSVHTERGRSVSQETSADTYRPEDNMHPWKLKRLYRAIQTYIMEKEVDNDWQLDLVTVRLNERTRQARVELVDNIVG